MVERFFDTLFGAVKSVDYGMKGSYTHKVYG